MLQNTGTYYFGQNKAVTNVLAGFPPTMNGNVIYHPFVGLPRWS